ncbi:hypothetical protein F4801DRAFT_582979 [Xylaria longipes]|nr:hypothetical protein F4801DRAFT_582979 [Xylaria longipes]
MIPFRNSGFGVLRGTLQADENPSTRRIRDWDIQWELYFAFFDVRSITMHGPVKLGSTDDLLNTYVLVASLRAIRKWIETTFREAMEDWFMPQAQTPATATATATATLAAPSTSAPSTQLGFHGLPSTEEEGVVGHEMG